jgi:anti-sigma B factor antagonist
MTNEQPFAANNVATATTGCVINEAWIGRTAVVSASGVIDMLTSPQLEASINACLDKNPTAVIVDLSDVDFLASAGMGVLVSARDRATGTAGFAVVADGPATSRPLKLVGLADVIGMYSSLEQARAALGE